MNVLPSNLKVGTRIEVCAHVGDKHFLYAAVIERVTSCLYVVREDLTGAKSVLFHKRDGSSVAYKPRVWMRLPRSAQ